MKKWIAFALVCVMVLSLCACGGKIDDETQDKLDLYNKYKKYIRLLEKEDYEKLLSEIQELYDDQQNREDPADPTPPANIVGPVDPPDPEVLPTVSPEPELPTQGNDPAAPTAEEQEVLDAYTAIYSRLHSNYWSQWHDEEADIYYNGEAAKHLWYAQYYSELQSLDLSVIDKWMGTEYLSEDVNWDYAYLLSCFTILEDVPLFQISTVTDRMGNADLGIYAWIYNENGLIHYEDYFTAQRKFEMILTDPMNLFAANTECAEYICDDSGRPVQVRHLNSSGDIAYLVDIFYDDAGNKIKETVQCNSGEADILYTYDDQNRLIELSYQSDINIYDNYHAYVITYTYDDRGNLLQSHKTDTYYGRVEAYESIVYTYDNSGKLVSGVRTYETLWNKVPDKITEDHYTFRCDEQGRILSMEVAFGDTYYISGSPNGVGGEISSNASEVSCSREFVYGDFVIFSFGA